MSACIAASIPSMAGPSFVLMFWNEDDPVALANPGGLIVGQEDVG